jgi:hypothetical protein
MNSATKPYLEVAAETFPKSEVPASMAFTAVSQYDDVKRFLCSRPLRRPARTRLARVDMDRIDAEAAKQAMTERGAVSLDQLEKELGL